MNYFKRIYYKWLLSQLRKTMEIDFGNKYNDAYEAQFQRNLFVEYERILSKLENLEP